MSHTIWRPFGKDRSGLAPQIRRVRAGRSKSREVGWWTRPYKAEIQSESIITATQQGYYLLEANTAQRLRRFEHTQEIGAKDQQSEMGDQDSEYERILLFETLHTLLRWKAVHYPGTVSIFPTVRPEPTPTQHIQESSSTSHREELDEFSPEEVLRRLQSGLLDHQSKRRLIIEAEVLDFQPQHLGPLHVVLRDFLAKFRESNDPEDLVAVGVAIRTCVATMRADEALAYAAHLLDASPRTPIPLEVELELAKMVVRKLTANPQRYADAPPELADRLFEIAGLYLNPRLLVREKYGAIAVNAVLGLVLLQGRYIAETLRLVSILNVPWFRQLLARRAGRLKDELGQRFPGEPFGELIGSLGELEAQVQSLGS